MNIVLCVIASMAGALSTQMVIRSITKLRDNYKKSKQESKFYND